MFIKNRIQILKIMYLKKLMLKGLSYSTLKKSTIRIFCGKDEKRSNTIQIQTAQNILPTYE